MSLPRSAAASPASHRVGCVAELFDEDVERTSAPAGETESHFGFLNRSSWVASDAARALMESWLADYPEEHRAELRRRLGDTNDTQHTAAWWELYLYRLFTRLGCTLEPHPTLSGTSRRPEFRLTTPGGSTFILEAITKRAGIVREDDRHEGREAALLGAINSVKHDVFGVSVEVVSVGKQTLRTRGHKRRIAAWLDGLDPHEEKWDGDVEDEDYVINEDGWHVVLNPYRHGDWPNPQPEADDRLIGVGPLLAGGVNVRTRIRDAIEEKRKRYGALDEPFVIAVLIDGYRVKHRDVFGALMGTSAIQYTMATRDTPGTSRWVRQNDGLWCRASGPVNTNISGLLVGSQSSVWNVDGDLPTLFLNPWADHPLPTDLELPFPRAIITPGDLNGAESLPGTATGADLFGLAPGWPGPTEEASD